MAHNILEHFLADNKDKDKDEILNNLLFVLQDVSFFGDYIKEIKEKNKSVKIIGIDYGTSKIGIAVSDDECKVAFPKDVLLGNWRDVITICEKLEENIKKYQASAVIIGFPKTNTGELHKNCEIIFETAKYFVFEKKIPTLLFDERFTTKYANRLQDDKQNDDARSACVILQNALDVLQDK